MTHGLLTIDFISLVPDSWDRLPNADEIRRELSQTLIAHSELAGEHVGVHAPPDGIEEVRLTAAALDQMRCMWHGHRHRDRQSPPAIPLKIFVYGFGQRDNRSWASVEIHPGLDDWAVDGPKSPA